MLVVLNNGQYAVEDLAIGQQMQANKLWEDRKPLSPWQLRHRDVSRGGKPRPFLKHPPAKQMATGRAAAAVA
jgi:hypothetical protein